MIMSDDAVGSRKANNSKNPDEDCQIVNRRTDCGLRTGIDPPLRPPLAAASNGQKLLVKGRDI